LSELDKKLLEALQKDGRISYTELAEKYDANVSTVSNRVQRLMDRGVLKIVGVVNPFKAGNSFVADFRLKIALPRLQSAIEILKEIQEVRFIAATTGTYNVVLEIYTSSNEELNRIMNEKIGSIEGVISIDTSVILEVHKQSYNYDIHLHNGFSD